MSEQELREALDYLVMAVSQMEGETIRFRVAHSQTVLRAEGELRFELAYGTEEALEFAREALARTAPGPAAEAEREIDKAAQTVHDELNELAGSLPESDHLRPYLFELASKLCEAIAQDAIDADARPAAPEPLCVCGHPLSRHSRSHLVGCMERLGSPEQCRCLRYEPSLTPEPAATSEVE